ncbi:hypothetical protein [Jiangella gansuensis]|uniref:hypothetical protein n=1 Tax=Jiangella gansuensis TaxID=281473 RepID=UPI0004BB2080|nr:hypothetical protein [Jiangella gansuensis]
MGGHALGEVQGGVSKCSAGTDVSVTEAFHTRETLAEADEMSGRSDDPLLSDRVTRMRGDATSEPGTRLALWRRALRAFERLGVPDAYELRQAMDALAAGNARSAAEEPADLHSWPRMRRDALAACGTAALSGVVRSP